jgi:hypothetical protein
MHIVQVQSNNVWSAPTTINKTNLPIALPNTSVKIYGNPFQKKKIDRRKLIQPILPSKVVEEVLPEELIQPIDQKANKQVNMWQFFTKTNQEILEKRNCL